MPIYSILLVCFFFSGATALIYEVLWVRLLALTFGNTVYAIGIVLTSFMSGLSLGSLIFGRWADKGKNLLKGYGALEIGIALSALISPILISRVTTIYLTLSVTSMPLWSISVIRYFLSIAVLLVPTTLMGGTLPVLSRYFIHSEAELEKKIGVLYSLNTLGGVFGTFLVGFLLIRAFGISSTLRVTALVNICIGVVSFYLGKEIPGTKDAVGEDGRVTGPSEPGYRFAVIAFFLSGLGAMVYEIAWNRLLVGVIGSTTYSFSIVLIGFLSGIALGSLIVSHISKKRRLGLVHFSVVEILIGVASFLTIFTFPLLPSLMLKGLQMTGGSYYSVLLIELLLVLAYILLPTTLFGATFPIIAAIYSGGQKHRGKNIGNIYAANTFGAILGSSVAAFYLLPYFGGYLSIRMAALVNVLVGITGLLLLRKFRLVAVFTPLLLFILIPAGISREYLVTGVSVYGKREDFTLKSDTQSFLYLKEGLNSTIAVTTNEDGSVTLSTNGKADGSTGQDMSTQLALSYFPLLLHPNPSDVLIIGYGTGVTVRAAADFPEVKKISAVEIEPAVIHTAPYFNQVANGADHDPKVTLFIDDARSNLNASPSKYDVIISEPSNPWISGIGNLFSKEFYETSLSRLNKGGMFCQWVQLYGLRPDVIRMIIRTFSSVFPEAMIWQSNPADILLIGSRGPLPEFDAASVTRKLKGKIGPNLKAYLNIYDAFDFFSYYVTGSEGVKSLGKNAAMNTDDLPLLEFESPFSLYASTHLENNALLREAMSLPSIKGGGAEDFDKLYMFRKSLNYMKLDIPISQEWILPAMSLESPYLFSRIEALDPAYPDRASSLKEALNYPLAHLGAGYNDLDLLGEAASIALKEGEFERARGYLQKAEEVPLNIVRHSELYYNAGMAFIGKGKEEEAGYYLRKSAATNPYNGNASLTLAELDFKRGQKAEACEYYNKAFTLFSGAIQKRIRETLENYCQLSPRSYK